jgi:hypothetical protein
MTDPRTAARHPGHVHARLSDKVLTKIIAGVLDQRVFGPDRAAMLTAQLPATAAEKTADRDRQAAALRRQLKKIETSQAALMTELEETGADPALLDAVPRAAGQFTTAPPEVREALYTALDVQILYRPDQNQMTIWVTITDATPQAIQDLLDDPRTDSDTGHPAETLWRSMAHPPPSGGGGSPRRGRSRWLLWR